tara:strand:- start:7235 stop:8560 length:1326 start_codon:yes stop_codon:yes gene_type:complete
MHPYNKVAFYTLGCKLNFSETSTIARSFQSAGYARVDYTEFANVYVINTCSVTDMADKKCRNIVNRAMRINPEAKVVVIGCYAQLKPEEIVSIPGVDLVLGANEKFNVIEHIEGIDKADNGKVIHGKIGRVKEFHPSFSAGDRTRTFFKVQDGCDYYCTFCTIPLARGKSRSNTVAQTIEKAKEIEATDVKEVVLTGVNTGDFGSGTDENFYDLVVALDQLNIDRFRISSIEPNLLTDDIIAFSAQSKKFVPHFHIPLQSGSDRILKNMKRKYLSALYADRVSKIKTLMPDACIGVDVIVGFPGETDEDFMETYNFLRDLDVSYFHVFTYSERPNTLADKMEEIVPVPVRQERNKMLRILSEKKKRAFYASQLNKVKTVLWEGENHEGYLQGFTENYVRVKTPYDAAKINTFEQVCLIHPDSENVVEVESVKDHAHAQSEL